MPDKRVIELSKNISTLTQEYIKAVCDKNISLFEINSIRNEIAFYIIYLIGQKTDFIISKFDYQLLCLINKSDEIGGIMFQAYSKILVTEEKITPESITERIAKICKNINNQNISVEFFILLKSKIYGKI